MATKTLPPRVLAVRTIPNVAGSLAAALDLEDRHSALGFLTVDQDDPTYVAIDEATKKADVAVVYARSFYAGAAYASGPTSGETLAILAGERIAEINAGLDAAIAHLESGVSYRSADGGEVGRYFAHLVARSGDYLSARAGIPRGEALGYLKATPLEATWALDHALKAAAVELVEWMGPPTPTNMAGALVTGTEADCRAACEAFEAAVLSVHRDPVRY
ncbi:MAG TPA: ethanolamine utilization microcompartment protein EutL [Gemmatimonadota bacterium]|nr:ethanolamine utilization microcompartment protein EutL [Gemmatimonadota bacterium]